MIFDNSLRDFGPRGPRGVCYAENIRSDVMVARGLRNPPVSMTIAILTGRSAAESIPHRPIRMQPKPSKLRKCAKQSQRETVFNCLSFKELHPPGSIISTKNKPDSASFGLINREGSHATNGQADEFGPPEIGRRKSSRFWTSGRSDRFWPRTKYWDRYGRVGDVSMTNSTAPDRSASRMQTMPGKSVATGAVAPVPRISTKSGPFSRGEWLESPPGSARGY